MALRCPHCNGTNLEFIAPVTLHTFQEKNGQLDVSWDMIQEFYQDDDHEPFRLEDFQKPNKWQLNNKKRVDTILCHSNKCEGRELKAEELIDENEFAHKNW